MRGCVGIRSPRSTCLPCGGRRGRLFLCDKCDSGGTLADLLSSTTKPSHRVTASVVLPVR